MEELSCLDGEGHIMFILSRTAINSSIPTAHLSTHIPSQSIFQQRLSVSVLSIYRNTSYCLRRVRELYVQCRGRSANDGNKGLNAEPLPDIPGDPDYVV